MLVSLLTAGVVLGGAPTIVPTKIVSASLFKNGYAVVVREAPLDKTGETYVATTPASTLGTVWFTTSEGTKLDDVVATDVGGSADAVYSSLDELLQANVGRQVTLALTEGDKVLGGSRSGTILSAQGNVVVLRCEDTTVAVAKASILSVTAPGEKLDWKKTVDTSSRALRVQSKGPAGGKMFMVSLERGITWAPAYAVDISDPKILKLTAKATLLNDLGDLDGVDVRLVTGFPNVPYSGLLDPLTSGQNLDQFMSTLMAAGTPDRFRGQGASMGSNSMMGQAGGTVNSRDFDQAFTPNPDAGEKVEDLFFYHQNAVKLKKGDRGYFALFSFEAPYEHVYTWAVDDAVVTVSRYGASPGAAPEGLGDVWHCLRFKNAGKQPLTTGPASTFKNGELLGQDLMTYISTGAQAEVKVTKALDVRAERSPEEVGREKGAIKRTDGYPIFDLVTIKETLQISNRKNEKIKMCVTRDLTGEVVSTEGSPKVNKTTKGLRDVNTHENVEWNVDVDAGKTVKLVFTYKLYVDSQGR